MAKSPYKTRRAGTLKAVVHDLVEECGDLKRVAEIARVGKSQLFRYTDDSEDNAGCHMPVDIVASLERHCGKAIVTEWLAAEHGAVLLQLDADPADDTIPQNVAEIAEHASRLFHEFATAFGDGRIDGVEAGRMLASGDAMNRAAKSAEQVRLTREAAEAAEALARAQASGDPAAVANARANLKVAEALRDGVIVQADKAAYAQVVLREELAGLSGQAGEAATVSSRQARQTLELAEATRQGGAAVAETTLRHQIENETLRVGAGAHSELARRLTEEAAARRVLAAAQFDRDLDVQIAATKALAEAEGKSATAVAETAIRNQVAAQVEKEGIKADSDRARSIAVKTPARLTPR